ncbi:MAG: MBL fold metallo-hydrolase, partial [Candidatus Zixiibacteriota bacterium]
RTGMSEAFLDWLKPQLAVISVGKNAYGHPASEILQMLADREIRVLRTDNHGDKEIISDGKFWTVR